MFLSHIDVSLSFTPLSFSKINKNISSDEDLKKLNSKGIKYLFIKEIDIHLKEGEREIRDVNVPKPSKWFQAPS